MSKEILNRYNAGDPLSPQEYMKLQKYLADQQAEMLKKAMERQPILPIPDNGSPSIEDNRFFPVVAKQDNEGHWYVIPTEMENDFSRLLDDSGTDEDAEQMFIETFSSYLTGGDLNLTQLYMKTETLDEALERDLNSDPLYATKRGPDIDEHGIAGPAPVKCPPINAQEHEYQTVFTMKQPGALEMVEEFHKAFDCPVYVIPSLPSYNGAYSETAEHLFNQVSDYFNRFQIKDSRTLLRMKLIFEEYKELCEAMREGNFVKILDGLCDLLYVTYGTAHEFGLGPVLKQAFTEVHRSNMSKLGADGKPIIREDGKVLKGPNFTPPDLFSIIFKATSVDQHPLWKHAALKEAVELGMSASLGANMPEMPGMPEPTNDGVIYSDLKVGNASMNEDGSMNIKITGTKSTPVVSFKASIEFNHAISTDDIELVLTCGACPEQYDAFYQGKQVGYLRLRNGHFTVDYLKCNGEEVFSACPDGDDCFTDEEREEYLTAAKNAIINRMLQELAE